MRAAKPTFVAAISIVLLAGSTVGVAGQEGTEVSGADASPPPDCTITATIPPVEQCGETPPVAGPLPVPGYWDEWTDHKQAYRWRAGHAIDNVKRSRSKPRFYEQLVGVHSDELKWLKNHQPHACYEDEYEKWRRAVEDLRSIHEQAVRFARDDNTSGIRRVTRQQKSAVKRLDKTVLNFADCDQLAPPEADRPPSRSPFVGSWKHKNNTVDVDGFHDTVSRKVRIGPDGRFLLRVKREHGCRKAGLGFVPLTVQGSGDFDLSGSPRFHWGSGTVHCYPRGKGRQVMGRDLSGTWWYDETADILLTSGACWFRAKAGSPSDCKVFWQGLPSPVEDGEAPLGEAAAAGEETTAAPDDGEG